MLVSEPEAVSVEQFSEDDGTVVLELSVGGEDYGRVIEILGQYNAQTDPSTIKVDEEKVRAWLAKGAQPTDTVRKLLRIQGIETAAK